MEEALEDFDGEFPDCVDRIFACKSTVTVKGKQLDIRSIACKREDGNRLTYFSSFALGLEGACP